MSEPNRSSRADTEVLKRIFKEQIKPHIVKRSRPPSELVDAVPNTRAKVPVVRRSRALPEPHGESGITVFCGKVDSEKVGEADSPLTKREWAEANEPLLFAGGGLRKTRVLREFDEAVKAAGYRAVESSLAGTIQADDELEEYVAERTNPINGRDERVAVIRYKPPVPGMSNEVPWQDDAEGYISLSDGLALIAKKFPDKPLPPIARISERLKRKDNPIRHMPHPTARRRKVQVNDLMRHAGWLFAQAEADRVTKEMERALDDDIRRRENLSR